MASFFVSGADGRNYITLAVQAGHKISYPWELRGLGIPRSWITLPNGIIAFRITGLESGGSTTMTIFVNGEMPHTYYKLGGTYGTGGLTGRTQLINLFAD